jgi:hypothetical protein
MDTVLHEVRPLNYPNFHFPQPLAIQLDRAINALLPAQNSPVAHEYTVSRLRINSGISSSQNRTETFIKNVLYTGQRCIILGALQSPVQTS